MKRKLAIFLFFVLASMTILSGCKKIVGTPEDNAGVEDETETEDGEEEEKAHLIGYSVIDMENPYFITLQEAIEDNLGEDSGYELVVKDPGTDADLQESQIREMVEEGIEAIILCPVDWEKITPSLQLLKEHDIKIINVDSEVMDMDYVDAFIGSDNYEAGKLCGEDLIKRCTEGGKIAILECPTQNSINDRITGFEKTISKADPGFEVVAREDCEGEFDLALEECTEILKNNDVDIIMCGNDQTAVAAKTAVNVAGLDDVIIYGVDGSPDIKKELAKDDNQIVATAAQSPIHMGKDIAETTLNILNGKEYEETIYEDVFLITHDNVDIYGTDGWQ